MENGGQETDPQELKRRRKAEQLLARKAATQEAQNLQFKNHLTRERGFSDETESKFFGQWERMVDQVKSEQLLEDLKQLQQGLGTVVDRKNGCIRRLVTFREEIGGIHDQCLRRLRNIIEYYIRLKDFLTATMMAQYQEDRQKLLNEFSEEAAMNEDYGTCQMDQLEASLARLREKMAREATDDHNWRLECADANISLQVEKCEILRDRKYTEMVSLYRRLQATLGEYFRTVLFPERHASYDRLVASTRHQQEGIEQRRCQIAVLTLKQTQLDHTLTLARIGGRRKLNTQRNCRLLLELKVHLLKQQQQRLTEDYRLKLREVCSITHHLKTLLADHLLWGERVAKLARLCAQYETDQDARFAARWFHDPDDDDGGLYGTLFRKINRIEAINIVLREERAILRHQNEALQSTVRVYCGRHKAGDPERLRLCGQVITGHP
ncbi:uncharacterized protein LOC128267069 [Anopheles cruzii]|uniref:uncharacterized protein LOC128267069 n=1 Tax=Anopheles cruzii TaxID=68878 RepID=UPI0022EC24D0|nr:uncharacterized protein LOC128267069 [Anopheles cruzii]